MSILLGIWLRKVKVNLEYTDYIIVAVAFLICIAVGIFLHIAFMWDRKPKTSIYDLWQAIGAREQCEFIVNLCRCKSTLICGTIKNLKKCDPNIPVLKPEDLKGGKDVENTAS